MKAGIPSSHLEDILNDMSYMDYGAAEPEKRMDKAYDYDYDSEPATADYIQPVDQGMNKIHCVSGTRLHC